MQGAEFPRCPSSTLLFLMDQDTAQPLIPCVFCNHLNTPGHRFCGMCGKALPDPSRKVAKPVAPANPNTPIAAPLRGIGGGVRLEPDVPARPIASIPFDSLRAGAPVSEVHPEPHPSAPRPPARPLNAAVASTPPAATRPRASLHEDPKHEDPNRDLSYLLEEDHAPPKPSRLPFVVGGVLLAVVAVFFAMRGGGKPASPEASDGTAPAPISEPAPDGKAPAKSTRPQAEKPAPVAEAATEQASDAASSDSSKEPAPEAKSEEGPAASEAPSVASTKKSPAPRAHPPSPKIVARQAPKPAASVTKPSPSQPAEEEAAPASAASVAASSDCERVPALRKAADRGDVKARTSLGLVYYSGQCVPRDLPTAYHWYALALRANPDNAQLSAQLEAIWKQMSPAERQVAIGPQR